MKSIYYCFISLSFLAGMFITAILYERDKGEDIDKVYKIHKNFYDLSYCKKCHKGGQK